MARGRYLAHVRGAERSPTADDANGGEVNREDELRVDKVLGHDDGEGVPATSARS